MKLSIGSKAPDICQAIIEVSRDSRNKYEFDRESGLLKLDRVIMTSMHYPVEYGFLPETLAGDGDEVDVILLSTEPMMPGIAVDIRPLGALIMSDEKGVDEKILAVAKKDPRFNHMNDIKDVPQMTLDEINNFFQYYKSLENKQVTLDGWRDAEFAKKLIVEGMERAKNA